MRQTTRPRPAAASRPRWVLTQLMPECGGLLEYLSNGLVSQLLARLDEGAGDDKRPVAG